MCCDESTENRRITDKQKTTNTDSKYGFHYAKNKTKSDRLHINRLEISNKECCIAEINVHTRDKHKCGCNTSSIEENTSLKRCNAIVRKRQAKMD